MAMVHRSFSCTRSSSIFAVLMGSSAEHGSSSSRTSGSTARAPRDAQALLLASGKLVGGFMQLILHFVPQRGVAQAFFHGVGDGALGAIDAQPVGHVFKNRFGKWIGPLKNHAHAAAQRSNVLGENILVINQDFAFQPRTAHGFVHAVQGAQQVWTCRIRKGRSAR